MDGLGALGAYINPKKFLILLQCPVQLFLIPTLNYPQTGWSYLQSIQSISVMRSFTFIAVLLLAVVSPIFVLARPIVTNLPSELFSRGDDEDVYLISRNLGVAEVLLREFDVQVYDTLMERRGAKAGVTPRQTSSKARNTHPPPSKKPAPNRGKPNTKTRVRSQANSPRPSYNWPVSAFSSPSTLPPKPSVVKRIVKWGKGVWNRIRGGSRAS
ncbi:hypothetical protein DFP72DRAFT_854887 [Ephemerocybe angulata]|uniref:Uncharacterized protein n=1 Tax=Ephemerocybe angulata TaxID=980116 RepID=A0A8H6HGX3_9AGAR|nr:hypothetical protein DFP72DRAFT_854887 [Tulosesus angulatus]